MIHVTSDSTEKYRLLSLEEAIQYKKAVLDLYKRAGGVLKHHSSSFIEIEIKKFLKIRVNFQRNFIDIVDNVNNIQTNYSNHVSFIEFLLEKIVKGEVVIDKESLLYEEQKVNSVNNETKKYLLKRAIKVFRLFSPYESDYCFAYFLNKEEIILKKDSKKLCYIRPKVVSLEFEVDDVTYETMVKEIEKRKENNVSISDAIENLNSLCLTTDENMVK